ncbi:MAG TPA: hypothetical protein VGC97_13285 [Pyrinomonadaceae bacterium]|jgi:hypothetical protein
MKKAKFKIYILFITALIFAGTARAQTNAFNYQGKLTDAGAPQATYQMQFKLFDAASGGSQIGSTIDNPSVAVSGGVFSVKLDFGANVFTGADRFLEISVRRSAADSYVTLSPRQQIASSPYSIRTLSAQQADLALNSNQLGGVAASEYVTNSTVGSSVIRNGTTLQTANFNISGNGLFGGSVGIGTPTNPNFRLDIFGNVRTFNGVAAHFVAAHFVAETTGGTNTWARFYMRSPSRSWFMGTSQNFNGNQLYFSDETAGQTRMVIDTNGNLGVGTTAPGARLAVSTPTTAAGNNTAYFEAPNIGPNASNIHFGTTGDWYIRSAASAGKVILQDTGGNVGIGTNTPPTTLYVEGNVGQNSAGFGLPKGMVYLLSNGTISRCYNATTGATTNGCGFTASRFQFAQYKIDFGFQVNKSFFSLVIRNHSAVTGGVATADDTSGLTVNQIYVYTSQDIGVQVIVY